MNRTRKTNSSRVTWTATLARFAFLGSSVILLPTASAHSVLTSPLPRIAGVNGSGLTTGPCGTARTAAQPVTMPPLTPGASLTVTWSETINHPGCFHVDFSAAGDLNFVPLAILPHSTAAALPRPYSTMVTLPTAPCAACTLRVRQIQLAADPVAGTCPETGITTYFSCANVVLGTGAGATGGTSGTGGATGTGGTTGTGTGGSFGSGTGGRGTGGATGSGGSAPGSGGTVGTGGTTVGSGGTTGTGGTTAGSGGATGTGGSVAGSGGAPGTGGTTGTGATDPNATGGCSYAGHTTRPGLVTPFVGILLALALRRRRTRNRAGRP